MEEKVLHFTFILLGRYLNDSTTGYFQESLYTLFQTTFLVLMKTDTYLSPYSYLHLPSCLSVVAINLLNKLYYGMFRQKYYSKC